MRPRADAARQAVSRSETGHKDVYKRQHKLYGAPVVVVDFGTATNMEVIDEKGTFAGGVIAPGVDTSARALFLSLIHI